MTTQGYGSEVQLSAKACRIIDEWDEIIAEANGELALNGVLIVPLDIGLYDQQILDEITGPAQPIA